MNDFIEKRDFYRMVVDGEVRYRIEGESQVSTGKVKNLSNSGLLMSSDREMTPGTKITIAIIPGHSITPPLLAEAKVIRSDSAESDQFNIACSIDRILTESDTGPDFP
ncbi:MAG: PilZ domain-containing protein [Candidatus Thiodiazotropha sp. (ex Clathrolucina costata)]|nr:PilZ domain-containing protein [Candidatus Thiodiazotropha taylori]